VTAWASTLKQAQEAAYAAVDCIRFPGAQYRRDIASKALHPFRANQTSGSCATASPAPAGDPQ
jgi:hypothetical protein